MLFDTTHLLIMLALWAVSTIAMFIKDWKTMTFSKFGNSIPFTIMFSYLVVYCTYYIIFFFEHGNKS